MTLVTEEIQRVESTLRELVSTLSAPEKSRLDMYRTLAFREDLIEAAVRDDLIDTQEDGVFAALVKKQVLLTRIVNGSASSE